MKSVKDLMLLYAVTDRAWTGRQTLYEQVEAALKNGVTCVQLREKELDDEAFAAEAEKMLTLCHSYQVPLIINDNVDVAVRVGADGVHVGQSDMQAGEVRRRIGPDKLLGVSVDTPEQARLAVENGADYLGAGAVFATSTKTDVGDMPAEMLQAICQASAVPVVAIGGICRDNVLQLSGSGVAGIAVVSAIFGAEDPGAASAELLELSKQMVAAHG